MNTNLFNDEPADLDDYAREVGHEPADAEPFGTVTCDCGHDVPEGEEIVIPFSHYTLCIECAEEAARDMAMDDFDRAYARERNNGWGD